MYVLNDYLKTTLRRFLRTETTNEVVTTSYCPGLKLYAFFILFHARRECDYVKHVLLAKYFTSVTVCKRVKGGRKSRIPLFFFHIAFPNSSFVSINKKQTNKAQFTVWSKRRQHSKCARLIRSLPLKRLISRIHNIRAKTSRIPCLNFGVSLFQGSCKILFPVKKFCVFPNRAPYFDQIPDPENTLPDLVQFSMFANSEFYASEGNLDCKTARIFS